MLLTCTFLLSLAVVQVVLTTAIVEGVNEVQHVEKIKDVKGNIIARWGGTCGRWDIS